MIHSSHQKVNVAAQPVLYLTDVLRRVGLDGHLMGAPVVLHLEAVHVVRAGPALGRAQHDHGPGRAAEVAGLAGVGLIGEHRRQSSRRA